MEILAALFINIEADKNYTMQQCIWLRQPLECKTMHEPTDTVIMFLNVSNEVTFEIETDSEFSIRGSICSPK